LTSCRKVGDPFKPDSQHGPQINQRQLEKIQKYVDEVSPKNQSLLAVF
jgi:acyl-CoA reductase-like NAD-dependent aldehyde dehydrogenase